MQANLDGVQDNPLDLCDRARLLTGQVRARDRTLCGEIPPKL